MFACRSVFILLILQLDNEVSCSCLNSHLQLGDDTHLSAKITQHIISDSRFSNVGLQWLAHGHAVTVLNSLLRLSDNKL